MAKPESMTRERAAVIQSEMEEALRAVAEKHGVGLSAAGFNYTATSARISFDVSQLSAGGEVMTREREWFKQYARMFGLELSMLDQPFVYEGKTYTVKGLSPRARRAPVNAVDAKGKPWRFNAVLVRDAFGAAAQKAAA